MECLGLGARFGTTSSATRVKFDQAKDLICALHSSRSSAEGVAFSMTVASNRGYGPHTIAMRVYAMGGRLYEMLAATRVEDRDDPTVTEFLNSLRVLR